MIIWLHRMLPLINIWLTMKSKIIGPACNGLTALNIFLLFMVAFESSAV